MTKTNDVLKTSDDTDEDGGCMKVYDDDEERAGRASDPQDVGFHPPTELSAARRHEGIDIDVYDLCNIFENYGYPIIAVCFVQPSN